MPAPCGPTRPRAAASGALAGNLGVLAQHRWMVIPRSYFARRDAVERRRYRSATRSRDRRVLALRSGDLLARLNPIGRRVLGRTVAIGDGTRALEVLPHALALLRLVAAALPAVETHARGP